MDEKISAKRSPEIRLRILDGVRMQNSRGEWILAIPEPWMGAFSYQCDCGKKFWHYETYRAYYALKHILAL